jgi:hypothetical protein
MNRATGLPAPAGPVPACSVSALPALGCRASQYTVFVGCLAERRSASPTVYLPKRVGSSRTPELEDDSVMSQARV